MKIPSILSEDAVTIFLQSAQKNMEKYGWLAPVLFVALSNVKNMMVPLELPHSSEGRQLYFQQIGHRIRASGKRILAAVFLSETWFIDPQEVPGATTFPPSKHPARQEAVVVVGRNAANTSTTYVMRPYTRGEDNRFVWEANLVAVYEQPVESGIRAVGLLDYLFEK